jgi:hypothetical protein
MPLTMNASTEATAELGCGSCGTTLGNAAISIMTCSPAARVATPAAEPAWAAATASPRLGYMAKLSAFKMTRIEDETTVI